MAPQTPYARRMLWYLRRGTLITTNDKSLATELHATWHSTASSRLKSKKTCTLRPFNRTRWMISVTPKPALETAEC